ncbi:hypothetical protein RUND412_009595 [Rhizina undulata]
MCLYDIHKYAAPCRTTMMVRVKGCYACIAGRQRCMEVSLRQRHWRSEGPCQRPEICNWCSNFETRAERLLAFRGIHHMGQVIYSRPTTPSTPNPKDSLHYVNHDNSPPTPASITMGVFDLEDNEYYEMTINDSNAAGSAVLSDIPHGVDILDGISTEGTIFWPRLGAVHHWKFSRWDDGDKSKVAVNFEDRTRDIYRPSANFPPPPQMVPHAVHQGARCNNCGGEQFPGHYSPAQLQGVQVRQAFPLNSAPGHRIQHLGAPGHFAQPVHSQLVNQQLPVLENHQHAALNQKYASQGNQQFTGRRFYQHAPLSYEQYTGSNYQEHSEQWSQQANQQGTTSAAPHGVIGRIIETSRAFYSH